jgi:hypothetical protein
LSCLGNKELIFIWQLAGVCLQLDMGFLFLLFEDKDLHDDDEVKNKLCDAAKKELDWLLFDDEIEGLDSVAESPERDHRVGKP